MAVTWGHGTTLKYGTVGAAANDMTAFDNIEKIDAGKMKRKMIKTTKLSSTGETEEKRPGLIEQDGVKLKVQYVSAQHATLLAIFQAGTQQDFLATFPDGATCRRTGYFAEFSVAPEADSEGIYINDIGLEFTGPPTFTGI